MESPKHKSFRDQHLVHWEVLFLLVMGICTSSQITMNTRIWAGREQWEIPICSWEGNCERWAAVRDAGWGKLKQECVVVACVRVWPCRGKKKENTERDTTEVETRGLGKRMRGTNRLEEEVMHQSVLVGTRWHPKRSKWMTFHSVWIKGLS